MVRGLGCILIVGKTVKAICYAPKETIVYFTIRPDGNKVSISNQRNSIVNNLILVFVETNKA